MQKEFTHNDKKYIARSEVIENHPSVHIYDESNNIVGTPLVGGSWQALAFAILGRSQGMLLSTNGVSEAVVIDRLIDAWIFEFKWRQIAKENQQAQGIPDPYSDVSALRR